MKRKGCVKHRDHVAERLMRCRATKRLSAVSGCSSVVRSDSMEDGGSSTTTLLVSLCERERCFYTAGRLPARLPQGEGVIGWSCRDREAAWICSAARRLGLDVDSFTLAVALLDRVICGTRVPTKYVNCVAAACLSLAKKLCEDHEEDASLYLQRLRLSYSARELKRMELRILELLGWDAHLPSFDRFLVALLKSMGGEWLMSPLRVHIEAIVCDSSVMSQFPPSTLALSVVSLLIEATSKQWMPAIQTQIKLCKTDPCELLRCRERLSNVWSRTLYPQRPAAVLRLSLPQVPAVILLQQQRLLPSPSLPHPGHRNPLRAEMFPSIFVVGVRSFCYAVRERHTDVQSNASSTVRIL
ncbi:unnamed protein product [Cylicocyclus nassatus]|uniref:Cyclin-like domain-containing protein n=1 Tax=Cylicocyclus nassatus TaxID=53992 RepID=A0AA36M6M7_CYLNA|nr:unnamed protein product [Cylicocyclus nassatus]